MNQIDLSKIKCEYVGPQKDTGLHRYRLTLVHEFDYGTLEPDDELDCQRTSQIVARNYLYKDIRNLVEKIFQSSNLDEAKFLANDTLSLIPKLENEGAHS